MFWKKYDLSFFATGMMTITHLFCIASTIPTGDKMIQDINSHAINYEQTSMKFGSEYIFFS